MIPTCNPCSYLLSSLRDGDRSQKAAVFGCGAGTPCGGAGAAVVGVGRVSGAQVQLGGMQGRLTGTCTESSAVAGNWVWAGKCVRLLLETRGCCGSPVFDLEDAQIPPRFPLADRRTTKHRGPAPAGFLGGLLPGPEASCACSMLSPVQMKLLESIHATQVGFTSDSWPLTANGLSTLPCKPTLFSF